MGYKTFLCILMIATIIIFSIGKSQTNHDKGKYAITNLTSKYTETYYCDTYTIENGYIVFKERDVLYKLDNYSIKVLTK